MLFTQSKAKNYTLKQFKRVKLSMRCHSKLHYINKTELNEAQFFHPAGESTLIFLPSIKLSW